MDKYLFPAIFEPRETKGYTVTFPDLPGCITEGDSLEETLLMAKEALELHLYGMEEDGDPIPSPASPEKIVVSTGAFVTIIEAWMKLIRDEMADKAVKKTLTIPKWLRNKGTGSSFRRKKTTNLSPCLRLPNFSKGHTR